MGNHITCCRQRWFQLSNDNLSEDSPTPADTNIREKLCYFNSAAVFQNEPIHSTKSEQLIRATTEVRHVPNTNCWSTQHICEREPDDFEYDPSFNASRHSLFITGMTGANDSPFSPKVLNRTYSIGHTSWRRVPGVVQPGHLRRWSSCYTAFIGDSCLAHPNQESILRSVSLAIELLFDSALNRANCNAAVDRRMDLSEQSVQQDIYDLYDERQFPLEFPSPSEFTSDFCMALSRTPKAHTIHEFIQALFRASFLGPQAAIVALVFLERLVNAAEVGLTPWSWRRQFLACLLLASKVLDDQAVWNTDYRRVLKDVRVDDLNALERHTLSLLQFNINVPLAVYARYYFDLLSTGQTLDLTNRISDRRLLSSDVAKQLQILSFTDDPDKSSHLRSLLGFNWTVAPSQLSNGTIHYLRISKRVRESSKNKVLSSKPEHTKEHSRPSSCQSRINTNQPPEVAIVDSICKRSSISDDEGPLLVDDETDYINNLSTPLFESLGEKLLPHASDENPHPIALLEQGEKHGKVDSAAYRLFRKNPVATFRTDQFDGLGFMRSVMGGDVAYTLLRDAGIY